MIAPISIEKLLSLPEDTDQWVVDGLLPDGGISAIVAKPKTGKTTLTRQLAVAVSRGEDFLERKTVQGTVLYLGLEEKRSEVVRHFKEMGVSSEPIYIHCGSAGDDINVALDTLKDLVSGSGASLAIIDTLFDFLTCSPNSYSRVKKGMAQLREIARSTGCHIVTVHHTNKGRVGQSTVAAMDSASGSVAIFGGVDTQIVLAKDEDDIVSIRSANRYGSPLPCARLVFDPTTRTVNLGEIVGSHNGKRYRDLVIELLASEPMRELDLRSAIGGNTGNTAFAIRELLAEGVIIREGKGKRGDPYVYRLAEKG